MSRSGYFDDCDSHWDLIKWRGQVASAIRGKRGQAFLRELLAALDAMPEKKLIAHDLIHEGNVCAIGSVGVARGVDLAALDPYDYDKIAEVFGIAHQLVQEIEWWNDEGGYRDAPEARWSRMREWVASQIAEPKEPAP